MRRSAFSYLKCGLALIAVSGACAFGWYEGFVPDAVMAPVGLLVTPVGLVFAGYGLFSHLS